MTDREKITTEDVSAYVDGRGSREWRTEVAAHLQSNPAASADADMYRRLNEELRELGREVLYQPVPDRLRQIVAPPAKLSRLKSWLQGGFETWSWRVVPAALSLVIGLGAGWYLRDEMIIRPSYVDSILTQSTYAFGVFTSDRDLPAQFGSENFDVFNGWASRTFGREIPPPDLSPAGYSFSGSRILPASGYTAGFYQFSRESAPDYAIYFWPVGSSDAIRDVMAIQRGDMDIRILRVGQIGFALMTQSRTDTLDDMAKLVTTFYRETLK
ncbi:MAG: hypothetical protein RIM84_24635 [Alphaproteobacteria bacterium]